MTVDVDKLQAIDMTQNRVPYGLLTEEEKAAPPSQRGMNCKAVRRPAVTADLEKLVKPLVWEEPCQRNNYTHIARSAFGEYYVDVDGGRHQAWLEAHEKPYERIIGDVVGNLYSAQSAAQADYARRIAAALDTDAVAEYVHNAQIALAERDAALQRAAYAEEMWGRCESKLLVGNTENKSS